eukprot:15331968-Alexandrium_andersonii.AAC.1
MMTRRSNDRRSDIWWQAPAQGKKVKQGEKGKGKSRVGETGFMPFEEFEAMVESWRESRVGDGGEHDTGRTL